MNLLELHITYLLNRHDCVIVPGLGAFVAQYTPASIDYQRGVINPPHRAIGFNSELTHNDGLLASSVARAYSISHNEALAKIAAEVRALRQAVKQQGTLTLSNLGQLTERPGMPVVFEPMVSPLTAPATFNLAPLKVVTVREAARREAIANGTYQPDDKRSFGDRVRAGLRVAASIAVLVGLGFLLTTPIVVDREAPDMASMTPTVTAPQSTSPSQLLRTLHDAPLYVSMPVDGSAVIDTFRRSLYTAQIRQLHSYYGVTSTAQPAEAQGVSTSAAPAQASSTQPQTNGAAAAVIRNIDTDPFCLIIGSLTTQAEAERFVRMTGDTSLKIVEMNGKYRVCAATGATQQQALQARSALGNKYPGAWICIRN